MGPSVGAEGKKKDTSEQQQPPVMRYQQLRLCPPHIWDGSDFKVLPYRPLTKLPEHQISCSIGDDRKSSLLGLKMCACTNR